MIRWSDDEIKRLRTSYRKMTPAELAAEFPGRSALAIRSKACEIGVSKAPRYDWQAIVSNHVPVIFNAGRRTGAMG